MDVAPSIAEWQRSRSHAVVIHADGKTEEIGDVPTALTFRQVAPLFEWLDRQAEADCGAVAI